MDKNENEENSNETIEIEQLRLELQQTKDNLVNTELQLQDLQNKNNELNNTVLEKEKIIKTQSIELNKYITKYNKSTITIDALQDKLLSKWSWKINVN